MSAVLSASIFSTEEEADIREEKHSSNDGKSNNSYYSSHYYSIVLLSDVLLGIVFAKREVEERLSYEHSAPTTRKSCNTSKDCPSPHKCMKKVCQALRK